MFTIGLKGGPIKKFIFFKLFNIALADNISLQFLHRLDHAL